MHSYCTPTVICKCSVDHDLISTLLTLLISSRVQLYTLPTPLSVHPSSAHIFNSAQSRPAPADLYSAHILNSAQSRPAPADLYSARILNSAQSRPAPADLYSAHNLNSAQSRPPPADLYSAHILCSYRYQCIIHTHRCLQAQSRPPADLYSTHISLILFHILCSYCYECSYTVPTSLSGSWLE